MSNFLVWPHTVVNWMRGSVCANYLRIGGIVAVALLAIVMAACAADGGTSGSNGDGTGPTDPVVTIDETTDCTTDADTACTFAVGDTFTGKVGGTDDPNDWVKVTLAINTSYRITATPGTTGTTATVAMYNATATAADPDIGSDDLYTATAAAVHYIEIGLSAAGGYELTIVAAPDGEEACSSMDAEADCDGDEVLNPNDEFAHDAARSCTVTADNGASDCDNDGHANSMDNCPAIANTDQTNTDNLDDDIATGGDAFGDVCDVDSDNDGLIEIRTLDDLNNIRYNLAGTSYKTSAGDTGSTNGAPTSSTTDCTTVVGSVYLCGYELMRSLDFAVAGDYASGMVNMDWRPNNADLASATNEGWLPLAHDTSSDAAFQGAQLSALLEGNNNTIANLYTNRDGQDYVALIGSISSDSVVRRLGLTDVFVAGADAIGGLVGVVNGTIVASWSSGSVTGTGLDVGGLVGILSDGQISASWSSGSITGTGSTIGGLIGRSGSAIVASYSIGSVTGSSAGGLAGDNAGNIVASWSSGSITSAGTDVGGLIGVERMSGDIATSYWDTTASMRIFGIGFDDTDEDNNLDNTDEDDNNNDVLDAGEDDDNDGRLDDGTETNQLADQGLTTAQMRAGTGTFPDFSAVVRLIGTVDANLLGDFSAAWDYTANCYPRLRQWTGAGTDGVIGTNDDTFHASELLPGQGTPGTGGACTGTP